MEIEKIKEVLRLGQGEIFEELVSLILKVKYPEYNFVHTAYKCDGGKDFYAVSKDDRMWAEAKAHKRHLELSRIAGTFIMADICMIDQIIIFSLSPLTEGAVANLAKYVSKHKKKLFVFDDNQIFEIIKQHSRFETAHILKDLSNWTGKLNIDTNVLFDCVSLDNFHVYLNQYKDNKSLIYAICAYKIFNEIVDCDISKDENIDKNNVVVESRYYSVNNSALHEEITDNIKAFDLFSSEIVLRNRNMADNKKVKIAFQENIRQFNLLSKHEYTVVLYPGQCIAAVFYFRAMNDSIQLKLPLPLIEVNERILNLPFDNTILNCSVVGETPYLGNDSISLNECCTELNKIARKFETVVVYGKSGVGKSRFLYELQKVRMQNQNTCFVFHGDNLCHSTYDFLRRIILGYYNISFNSQTGKIELPFYEENFIHDKLFIKNISFIESIINGDKIDNTYARNWLVSLLKNNDITLVIDNVQVLNSDTVSLLSEVVSDLDSCICNSEIVLSFNTDFIFNNPSLSVFFSYIKNKVAKPLKIEVLGFNRYFAKEYLRHCLDPNGIRSDLDDLCDIILQRLEPKSDLNINSNTAYNPLFLKQIILYLYQCKIIGFSNDTFCILNNEKFLAALQDLPETLFETITIRYKLLQEHYIKHKKQLSDLLWAVLIFGEMPEYFVKSIIAEEHDVFKTCIELGFLKYGVSNTVIFEHGLIAKAVLLLLENKPYCEQPTITSIKINKLTAKRILKTCDLSSYSVVKLIITDYIKSLSLLKFTEIMFDISYAAVPDYLLQYGTNLVMRYLKCYNGKVNAKIKIKALLNMMHSSQDKLGAQRTQKMFSYIINYQVKNYKLNIGAVDDFVELMKFYMYELPNSDKDAFLANMCDIGEELYKQAGLENKCDDFRIWILWATGKNCMHYKRDFKNAEQILKKGITLAQSTQNIHRRAELEIQYGDLYGYLENKSEAIRHWRNAADCFSSCELYDEILKLVYRGNVFLLEKKLSKVDDILHNLNEFYDKPDCYAFLKTIINDFLSNYLILFSISTNAFDETLHNNVKLILSRYRSVALAYNTNSYMLAAYKTVGYLISYAQNSPRSLFRVCRQDRERGI